MKYLSKDEGFTLMEIIVGINLGFVLLTVIVSFFLFSTKFIATTTKDLDSRQNVNDYLFRLGSMLRKSDNFYIQQRDSSTIFVVNDKDTISVRSNNFSLINLYNIPDISDYSFDIKLISGEKVTINEGILERTFRGEQNSAILSSEIVNIILALKVKAQPYVFQYYVPNSSVNRFKNLSL